MGRELFLSRVGSSRKIRRGLFDLVSTLSKRPQSLHIHWRGSTPYAPSADRHAEQPSTMHRTCVVAPGPPTMEKYDPLHQTKYRMRSKSSAPGKFPVVVSASIAPRIPYRQSNQTTFLKGTCTVAIYIQIGSSWSISLLDPVFSVSVKLCDYGRGDCCRFLNFLS